jgi:competence protein ComGC
MKPVYRFVWATGYWRRVAIVLLVLAVPLARAQTDQLSQQGRQDQIECLHEGQSAAYVAAQTQAGQSDAQIQAGMIASRIHPLMDGTRATIERLAPNLAVEDIRGVVYGGCMQQLGRTP